MLSFVKVAFFLRIFDEFSFLVQMMQAVFNDLKYFFYFFGIFVFFFSIVLNISQ
jgi:hypothetical protein